MKTVRNALLALAVILCGTLAWAQSQQAAQWNYTIDPSGGVSTATYPGLIYMPGLGSGTIASSVGLDTNGQLVKGAGGGFVGACSGSTKHCAFGNNAAVDTINAPNTYAGPYSAIIIAQDADTPASSFLATTTYANTSPLSAIWDYADETNFTSAANSTVNEYSSFASFDIYHGSGAVTNMNGADLEPEYKASGGTLSFFQGLTVNPTADGTGGTITNAIGVDVNMDIERPATNVEGIYVAGLTATGGTNEYGLFVDDQTGNGATNTFESWFKGNNPNVFDFGVTVGGKSGTRITGPNTGSGVLKFPAGSLDMTATGCSGCVLKQSSVGAPITVGTVSATGGAIEGCSGTISGGVFTQTASFGGVTCTRTALGIIQAALGSTPLVLGSGFCSLSEPAATSQRTCYFISTGPFAASTNVSAQFQNASNSNEDPPFISLTFF